MPSRRRFRHASTNNAPQVLLNSNNIKNQSSSNNSSNLNNNNKNLSNNYTNQSQLLSTSSTSLSSSGRTQLTTTNQSNSSSSLFYATYLNNTNNSSSSTSSYNNNNNYNNNLNNHHGNNNNQFANQQQHLLSSSSSSGVGGGDALTEKQIRNAYLTTLTKDQLKIECRKRGQKTNGNRTELLQRLGVKMSQLKNQEQHSGSDSMHNRKGSNSTTKTTTNPTNTQITNNNMELNLTKSGGNTQRSGGTTNGSPNGAAPTFVRKQSPKDKEKEREEREKIVLWRRPIQTVKYSTLECATLTQIYGKKLLQHKTLLMGLLVLVVLIGTLYNIPGRHQLVIETIRTNIWFIIYWVGLGVLSSVGLGTGLHTFLLYLGPHIASVTLAAYECNALNFPKPPYPDEIICPEISDTSIVPNLWNIMAKVRLEAFLWGAGTALGELPPYFMAKAARLSGYDPDDDEDLKKFEELKKKQNSDDLSLLDRGKLFMERVVEKVGFFGILACASIPNPLFDLAGITCGHFLVPFWTFFGATLLGKAVIKMHIQKIFVIIAFNEALIERAVDLIVLVPIFGKRLQEPFKNFLENQKTRLHRRHTSSSSPESVNLLAKIFEKFVIMMICYFIISIVNSLAQSYHKRIHKKGGKVYRKIAKD